MRNDPMPSLASAGEDERLQTLADFDIMDTAPEVEFDQLAFLAARALRTPVALITLVGRDRQYFKARVGTDICETTREVSFCAHALGSCDVLVVPDATQDARFSSNPLVTGKPGIRFYAGAPLITKQGHAIGSVCAIDFKPRDGISDDDVRALKDLADIVMRQMETRRMRLVAEKAQCAERKLSESEDRFRLLVQSITDYAIYMIDTDGIVTNWNPGAQRFKGYTADEIVGRNFECFYTQEDRSSRLPQRAMETARKFDRFEGEGWRVRKDGSRFWANVVLDPVRDEDGSLIGFAKITRDITERRENEQRLYQLAHSDSLTGLPNRLALLKMLGETFEVEQPVTLLLLDLDGFKDINDTLGHAAGDFILGAAGRRIQECVDNNGTVGRLGGDEFLVICPNRADPVYAGALCKQLLDVFRPSFCWEGQELFLGLTIGIATSHAASSPEELLADADFALYQAKEEERGGYALFQPKLRQAALARRSCEGALREAVDEGNLELFYQPQVQLSDRRIVGAEALLRWRHPDKGLLAPGAFLQVLERSSLAPVVGDWIIPTACELGASVRKAGLKDFRVGVNLFGAQFRSGKLVTVVTQSLSRHDLPPEAIELELTENIILQHDLEVLEPLLQLRALGVGIAFDDYGTGYASLSLLKRFPLSRLKIDQSFVRELNTNSADRAVVKAVIYLASSFELEVIAEGIETELQDSELRHLGCTQGQGYFYGRPVPASQFLQLVERQQSGAIHPDTGLPAKLAGVSTG
jgi:diguanylate cyclase (GGDEF)-like protein/PAS domain S-box-containing protein